MTRAERRHQRARAKAKHLRYWRGQIFGGDVLDPPKDIAKRHPADCGNSRCGICSYEKTWYGYKPRRRAERAVIAAELDA